MTCNTSTKYYIGLPMSYSFDKSHKVICKIVMVNSVVVLDKDNNNMMTYYDIYAINSNSNKLESQSQMHNGVFNAQGLIIGLNDGLYRLFDSYDDVIRTICSEGLRQKRTISKSIKNGTYLPLEDLNIDISKLPRYQYYYLVHSNTNRQISRLLQIVSILQTGKKVEDVNNAPYLISGALWNCNKLLIIILSIMLILFILPFIPFLSFGKGIAITCIWVLGAIGFLCDAFFTFKRVSSIRSIKKILKYPH